MVFGDPDRARRFASWTLLGFEGARESSFLGINARMPEITAVVAHAALDDWERERDEWRAARRLATAVETALGMEPVPLRGVDAHPYWIVRFPDQASRQAAERSLAASGIDSRRWWADGCHRQPAYATLPRHGLPVTERLAATTLGLPFSRSLTTDEAARIGDALARVIRS